MLWWVFGGKVYRGHNRPEIKRKRKLKKEASKRSSHPRNNSGSRLLVDVHRAAVFLYLTNINTAHDQTRTQVKAYSSTLVLFLMAPLTV